MMRRFKFVNVVVAIVTPALFLGACGNPSPGSDAPASTSAPTTNAAESSGADVAVSRREGPFWEARLVGTLSVIGDSCLGITNGPNKLALVWRPATEIVSRNPLAISYKGVKLTVGQEIELGGGSIDDVSDYADLPDGCAEFPTFLVGAIVLPK